MCQKKGMLDLVLKKQKFPNSKLPTLDSRNEMVERERKKQETEKNYSEGK